MKASVNGRRKSTTTRRKKTTTRRKKASVSGSSTVPKTKTFAGETFRHVACSKTKTDAKKRAESLRSKGKKARVVKTTGGHCVYSRG